MAQPLYVKSQVPAGASGEWVIERYEVPEPEVEDRRPLWARSSPGRYTRLSRASTVYMTDGHEEWWSQRHAIEEACRRGGRVLISGLGLGVVIESMFLTSDSQVEHITVLEASADVIRLVAPHLQSRYGEKLQILHADAFEWLPPPGIRYSVAWHDIWPNPYQESNAPEMDRLEERYAPYCDWQGVWARDFIVEGRTSRCRSGQMPCLSGNS